MDFDPQSLDNWAGQITSEISNFKETLSFHTAELRRQNGNYADACKRMEKMEAWRVIHSEQHKAKEERIAKRNRWLMIICITLITFFLSVAGLALDQYLI